MKGMMHLMNRTEQNGTERNRTEQNGTEQNRTEQNRTEQNRTEQNRTLRDYKWFFEIVKIKGMKMFPLMYWLFGKIALSGINFNASALFLSMIYSAVILPFAFLFNLYQKIAGKFILGTCCINITTRCTLKCKDCASMIPHYSDPKNMELHDILSDIDKILAIVDYIYVFQLAGGEPFMHKDMDAIVGKLVNSPKIGLLNIVTNGAIVPAASIIQALKNRKITVQISGYPKKLVNNVDQLMETLKQNKIRFTYSKDLTWKDCKVGTDKNRTVDQRRKIFEVCVTSVCNFLINGEFHKCPSSGHLMNNGILQRNDRDFVNIRQLSATEARKRIRTLLKCDELTACGYCDGTSIYTPTIPPAIQIE
jgi:MoaA/NifB/PqqE/SkfB family radical SAM enzyme